MNARNELDPRQWALAQRWLARADGDLHGVEPILGQFSDSAFLAAFHCHQAAEKMAKAVLIASNVVPPRIHDIERLGRLVAEHHAGPGEAIAHLGRVSTWYVSARYPEDAFDLAPSEQDIRDALIELKKLRQHISAFAPKL